MMMLKIHYSIKGFLLLLVFSLVFFANTFAQEQVVRREKVVDAHEHVVKNNKAKKSDKSSHKTHSSYPYVRRYKNAIWYKMSKNYGLWLNSIVLSTEYTTLNREIMPTESEVYAYSESSQYLLDLDTNIKYYIKKSEIGIGMAHRRYFYNSMFESVPFKEYYEPLPITARRVRLFDGEHFAREIIYL